MCSLPLSLCLFLFSLLDAALQLRMALKVRRAERREQSEFSSVQRKRGITRARERKKRKSRVIDQLAIALFLPQGDSVVALRYITVTQIFLQVAIVVMHFRVGRSRPQSRPDSTWDGSIAVDSMRHTWTMSTPARTTLREKKDKEEERVSARGRNWLWSREEQMCNLYLSWPAKLANDK